MKLLLEGDPLGELELSCVGPPTHLGDDDRAGESGVWLRGVELLEWEERIGDMGPKSCIGLDVLMLIGLSKEGRLSISSGLALLLS